MGRLISAIKNAGLLLKETFYHWNEREPFNNSIIIAYYTIFSLPGLLVIIINLAGYFFIEIFPPFLTRVFDWYAFVSTG